MTQMRLPANPARADRNTGVNHWISYYLYYETDPSQLLAETMWPLVQRLRDEQLIKQFFFIRYGDARGPHIRLRLLPADASLRRTSMRQVKKAFPAARHVAYVPETARYGGPAGLPIAEQLFDASSTAILQQLASEKSWSYSRSLACALHMHIGMLQAFGASRAEVRDLCRHLFDREPPERVSAFEKTFAAQRQVLVPTLTALWDAHERQMRFQDAWFAAWGQAMTRTGAAMRHLHEARALILADSPLHKNPLWCLYESYIHMTNNRLGIVNNDEPFLAYLLLRAFESRVSS